MIATDKLEDYFNFTHPHRISQPGAFQHRLGAFQTCGRGKRPRLPYPSIGVLHVPVYDAGGPSGDDLTAEIVAAYLADPPENQNPEKYGRRFASVHACADRDSFVLCLPADAVCWGCGNFNTAEDSWEVEIAGLSTEPPGYWATEDGTKKLVQAARAHVTAAKLAFGDSWRLGLVPPQLGQVDEAGRVVRSGWLQHRDIPYWTGTKWAQPPADNIRAGQHSDICAGFPWMHFFGVLAAEINKG